VSTVSNSSLLDPMRNLGVCKTEYIYVFSGFNEHKLNECEVFNTSTMQWLEIAPVKQARTKFSALSISRSRIMIFGGKQ
jgi:hypothetical protein